MDTKRVRTPRLDVAYLEHGPADGPAVLLLHGFPDDATAWRPVMERLAEAGRRTVSPYVRGCGGAEGTRFLRDDTPRAGDFPTLGQDAVDVVDALDLRDLTVVGQDWGSPTAEIVAIEGALGAVAGSFGGDDWRRVALSAYRSGTGDAESDPADDGLRERLKQAPPVRCEAVIAHGADDGVERSPLTDEALARYFPAGVRVEALAGVGHWPQRERPEAVVRAVLG